MPELDPRLHFVAITGIVVHDGKFLVVKRAPHEKHFRIDGPCRAENWY